MLALIPVRDGALPAGAAETVAECGHRAMLIGSGVELAAMQLSGELQLCEVGDFRPGAWSAALAVALAAESVIVLPASPDGRDLGPRLAAALDRAFFAGAMQITSTTVTVPRDGGLMMHTLSAPPQLVATLQVGVRGVEPTSQPATTSWTTLDLDDDAPPDSVVVQILAPDAATIDLAEATRIVSGGAGLNGPEQFDHLVVIGAALGASVGATRVITDRGWVGHDRQIGTTGVIVDPRLYLAFGVSGAVQHTSGLGHPEHIISVNIDAHCPMMQMADLAVVADANAVVVALAELLTSSDRADNPGYEGCDG